MSTEISRMLNSAGFLLSHVIVPCKQIHSYQITPPPHDAACQLRSAFESLLCAPSPSNVRWVITRDKVFFVVALPLWNVLCDNTPAASSSRLQVSGEILLICSEVFVDSTDNVVLLNMNERNHLPQKQGLQFETELISLGLCSPITCHQGPSFN